jgi:hypothetical protein
VASVYLASQRGLAVVHEERLVHQVQPGLFVRLALMVTGMDKPDRSRLRPSFTSTFGDPAGGVPVAQLRLLSRGSSVAGAACCKNKGPKSDVR